jgi:hypothetical protein
MKNQVSHSFHQKKSLTEWRYLAELIQMSYDIIKPDGGELSAETNEGEGSEFVIIIPVS